MPTDKDKCSQQVLCHFIQHFMLSLTIFSHKNIELNDLYFALPFKEQLGLNKI